MTEEYRCPNCTSEGRRIAGGWISCRGCGYIATPREFAPTWTCCGGIRLEKEEKCPVCGESYE